MVKLSAIVTAKPVPTLDWLKVPAWVSATVSPATTPTKVPPLTVAVLVAS